MARIAGVNIPTNKRVVIALQYIHGIGPRFAQEIMDDGSNVILCVGQPVWAYCQDGAIPEFLNFAFASLIVSGGFPRVDGGKPRRRHNVRLVLTGDTHHYSHFIEQGTDPNVRVHYLACGQGGAFLHPTHWLRDTTVEVEWKAAQPLVQLCQRIQQFLIEFVLLFILEYGINKLR